MYRIRQTVYWEHSSHCISTNHRISDTDDKGLLKWSIHTNKTSVPGKAINIGSGLKWEEQDLTAAASHTSAWQLHTLQLKDSAVRGHAPGIWLYRGSEGPAPEPLGPRPQPEQMTFIENSFLFSPETAFKVWIWYLDNSWDSFLWKTDRHQSLNKSSKTLYFKTLRKNICYIWCINVSLIIKSVCVCYQL